MRWHIGNLVSGVAIGIAIVTVAPDATLNWNMVLAVAIAAFGTSLGDAISHSRF